MNKNASEKKQGQFHQGQYVPAAETGRPVCRIHKFPGSPKKYLPKKADCMVSYRYSSFRVDMVDCFLLIRFYHKPVRSCLIFMKKKSLFYAGFRVSQSPTDNELKRFAIHSLYLPPTIINSDWIFTKSKGFNNSYILFS